MRPDVVVVGGGIVGCACAWEVAVAGSRVLLLERAGLAAGASGHNQGLLQPNADPLYHVMFQEAVRRYERLDEEGEVRLNLQATSQLVLADEATLPGTRRVAASFAAAGVPVEVLERGDLLAAEPRLAPDLAGGFHLPGVRVLDPAAATLAMAEAARRAGATIRTHEQVWSLLRDGDRVTGVLAGSGPVRAAAVLVAAGPASGALLAAANLHLPVTGARGWLLQTAPLPWRMAHILGEADWQGVAPAAFGQPPAMRDLADGSPGAGGTAVAFTMQQAPSGRQATIGASATSVLRDDAGAAETAVRLVATRAVRFVPSLAAIPVTRTWSGVRPVAPHGTPLIGRLPEVEGLWVAAGHGSQGVMLAPSTGRMMAEYLLGGRASGADAFDPARLLERR